MSNLVNTLGVDLAIVTALPPQGMITLRGDFVDADLAAIVADTTDTELPEPRKIVLSGSVGLGWMSPDELLILCPHADADNLVSALSSALTGHHALAVNVSDARAVFTVQGPHAREVIAKLAPVDLAPVAFQPGELRRTRLAQVAAAFWMDSSDGFRIVCFRSVAQYVSDILTKSARAGGIVDHF